MSNVDNMSTSDNPRSLKNIFLDLKSDLKTKSDYSFKLKKKFEECVGSSSEISGNSNSNFDEEISMFLKNTNHPSNLMDLLNKKYFIGYAISEAFSGTDLDAYTLFHIWNTKRTSQKSFVLSNQNFNTQEEILELNNCQESVYKDIFVIFYQQLFFSWQSDLDSIDRNRPIFKIPPQNKSLVHAIEPKTTCLIILTYIYGLNNIKFLGLRNDPKHSIIPGPYMSLFNNDSRGDFLKCITKFSEMVFNKNLDNNNNNCDSINYLNIEGYLNISYFIHELDLIYTYILFDDKCYSNYTEPILLKSFTNWTYGKIKLFLYSYRIKFRYRNLNISDILKKFDIILSLICKIFTEHKSSSKQAPMDKFHPKNFNFLCFTCVVYSYLYAILSIPLELLPWENFVFDTPLPTVDNNNNNNTKINTSNNNNNNININNNKDNNNTDSIINNKNGSNNINTNNTNIIKDNNNTDSINNNNREENNKNNNNNSNSNLDVFSNLNQNNNNKTVDISSESNEFENENQDNENYNKNLNNNKYNNNNNYYNNTDNNKYNNNNNYNITTTTTNNNNNEKYYEDKESILENLDNEELNSNYDIINMSVHNEFAETAADSTCIENTRRHDNLMTYIIGLINGEGNWIKKKEKFVDVIDTYKLGLSWYRRPSFSNTLYNTSYKAWPIALYYYYLLIEPCGRSFFVWYWKNIEAWNCSNIWSYRIKLSITKKFNILQLFKKLKRKKYLYTDSNLLFKRQVSLRLRDTVSYLFDMEMELKRALLYT